MRKKIDAMHHLFGVDRGHLCKECSNCIKVTPGNTSVYKCLIYGETKSSASDWNSRSWACGMFGKKYNDTPIIRTLERDKPIEPVPEGQIKMELL